MSEVLSRSRPEPAIPPATLSALSTPGDLAAQTAAADLQLLTTTGPKVQQAADQLTALGAVPEADLGYLQPNGAKVTQAAKDSPEQWRTRWFVCVAGQIVILPFIFVMAGRWSPPRAHEDADRHEQAVQPERQALGVAGVA